MKRYWRSVRKTVGNISSGTRKEAPPSIEKEYQAIPEKNKAGKAEYINGVIFGERDVNVLKYMETKIRKGEAVTREYAWITSMEITDKNAQKNHYLMEQISDFIKQLYEYFFLKKNEIKKTQKNISSELLASFGRQLTETEDILVDYVEMLSTFPGILKALGCSISSPDISQSNCCQASGFTSSEFLDHLNLP